MIPQNLQTDLIVINLNIIYNTVSKFFRQWCPKKISSVEKYRNSFLKKLKHNQFLFSVSVRGINGLENKKSSHMVLEFITVHNFDMYMPSVLGIATTQNRKQSPVIEPSNV